MSSQGFYLIAASADATADDPAAHECVDVVVHSVLFGHHVQRYEQRIGIVGITITISMRHICSWVCFGI